MAQEQQQTLNEDDVTDILLEGLDLWYLLGIKEPTVDHLDSVIARLAIALAHQVPSDAGFEPGDDVASGLDMIAANIRAMRQAGLIP